MNSKSVKVSRHWFILLGPLLMVSLVTTACGGPENKVSTLIIKAVDSADQAVKPTAENGNKATTEKIKTIRDAQALVNKVAATYKLVSGSENGGPFEDMANALGAKAEYLETGNKNANDTFNSLYEKSRTQLLKFAEVLKEKGL